MIPKRIIISRTDSIGDVILTLPMAGALKACNPDLEILFLGKSYTQDVVALSQYVDEFLNWDDVYDSSEEEKRNFIADLNADTIIHVFPRPDIAKASAKAKVPFRIGSTGRLYHYLYCNKLVPLSRKKSPFHELQLNFKLLEPIIGKAPFPELNEMAKFYGFQIKNKPDGKLTALIDTKKFSLILHPRSKGSAREWPLDRYESLIKLLPDKEFKIFVTGTETEAEMMKSFLAKNSDRITDLTGRFTLNEFIQFIDLCDGLVAASTGPLHIAAALNKLAIGIYPPIWPMHPGRWAPIGQHAEYLVVDKNCDDCRKAGACHCMAEISAQQVMNRLENYVRK